MANIERSSFPSFDETIMFACMVSTEILLMGSRCVFHVSSEKGGSTMSEMKQSLEHNDHMSQILDLSRTAQDINRLRLATMDLIHQRIEAGDTITSEALKPYELLLECVIQSLDGRVWSLFAGDE